MGPDMEKLTAFRITAAHTKEGETGICLELGQLGGESPQSVFLLEECIAWDLIAKICAGLAQARKDRKAHGN